MTDARHIFLEIDTYKLINASIHDKGGDALVLENTRLFDQGSMALGNPIQSFTIPVRENLDIFFTILPHLLYTDHKLYFEELKQMEKSEIKIISSLNSGERPVSFKVTVEKAPNDSKLVFSLKAALQYQQGTDIKIMNLSIDPVLRANQGHGED
ncbi:hypothetical protein [Chitinophaga nivalis]|uniref:Type VI secretion system needle protein Hcp n=1 Tax=Chitinophaga nivalis TaxID=2991709 RepID=A0ABT3IMG4_9BACT|nr:hypothetical protein [Chitinophaga nivalis]MCW3465141.1 hypothetical protein [Chitinophaga nivalis]MCW3485167.1 hypothetical protein [Chitinophaga nivalis]